MARRDAEERPEEAAAATEADADTDADVDYRWLPLSSVVDLEATVAISSYAFHDQIGQGTFGDVWRAKSPSSELVAVKELRKDVAGSVGALAPQIRREISTLRALDHENIINVRHIGLEDHVEDIYEQSVYLILEFVPFNLADFICDAEEPVILGEVKCLFRQLLHGLDYLHRQGIIHRDLKTENILLAESGTLKISDFNTARHLPRSEGAMTPDTTTLWYAPPEVQLRTEHYTSAIDLFSAGCVLAEMLLREPLFQADSPDGQLKLMWRILGTPTDEEVLSLRDNRCPELEDWLATPSLPQSSGTLETKLNAWDSATAAMLRMLLRWSPTARFTASEALGEESKRDVSTARAWWTTEPRAVKRRELSFTRESSGASEPSREEPDKSAREAELGRSPNRKRARLT